VDVKGGGPFTLEGLEAQHGVLPETLVSQTGGGGRHYFFQHPGGHVGNIGGLRPGLDIKADGGQVVVEPSRHPSGGQYTWLDAGPGEVEIAAAPEWLLEIIREHAAKHVREALPRKPPVEGARCRPGDDFNRRATWNEVLLPHGWAIDGRKEAVTYWRRPGKDSGVSATTGFCSGSDGKDLLYCFSSNVTPFEAERSYSKFAAFALLNHRGDFGQAALALAEAGYGDKPATAAAKDLPNIDVTVGDLAVLTAHAWDAIRKANEPPFLFRHGDLPSRIEQDDAGRSILREVNLDRMRHALARVAFWHKWKEDSSGEVVPRPAYPPVAVVRDVLASPDPDLPVLTRIVYVPVFGPGGTVLHAPGYHPDARVFYESQGLVVPDVPDVPSEAHVASAREVILTEWLGDFPFDSPADCAAAVALFLLPFCRDLVEGPTPLHVIEKPTPGTGASLMVELFSIVATNAPPRVMTEGGDEDEWRKRITATLLESPTFLVVDNLRRRLDSAAFSAALTADTWSDRMLGFTRKISLPVRCCWICTGNNPSFSNEISRRSVPIRLDAKVDRPWQRDRETFRQPDIPAWTRAHRGELVWAALVLIRKWVTDGRPKESAVTLGSYGSWVETLGGILKSAGIPAFLDNLVTFYERADEESQNWLALVDAWWEQHGEEKVTTAQIFQLIVDQGLDFPLGKGSEQAQKVRLGFELRHARSRRFKVTLLSGQVMEVRLDPAGTYRGRPRWQLLPGIIGSAGVAGVAGVLPDRCTKADGCEIGDRENPGDPGNSHHVHAPREEYQDGEEVWK
jgi:hypothetical protein